MTLYKLFYNGDNITLYEDGIKNSTSTNYIIDVHSGKKHYKKCEENKVRFLDDGISATVFTTESTKIADCYDSLIKILLSKIAININNLQVKEDYLQHLKVKRDLIKGENNENK